MSSLPGENDSSDKYKDVCEGFSNTPLIQSYSDEIRDILMKIPLHDYNLLMFNEMIKRLTIDLCLGKDVEKLIKNIKDGENQKFILKEWRRLAIERGREIYSRYGSEHCVSPPRNNTPVEERKTTMYEHIIDLPNVSRSLRLFAKGGIKREMNRRLCKCDGDCPPGCLGVYMAKSYHLNSTSVLHFMYNTADEVLNEFLNDSFGCGKIEDENPGDISQCMFKVPIDEKLISFYKKYSNYVYRRGCLSDIFNKIKIFQKMVFPSKDEKGIPFHLLKGKIFCNMQGSTEIPFIKYEGEFGILQKSPSWNKILENEDINSLFNAIMISYQKEAHVLDAYKCPLTRGLIMYDLAEVTFYMRVYMGNMFSSPFIDEIIERCNKNDFPYEELKKDMMECPLWKIIE